MEFKEASEIFDLYIDWDRRLDRELPCLLSRLKKYNSRCVADVACGIGAHAVALADAGYMVTAFDPDPLLCSKVRTRAKKHGVELAVEQASFHELPGPWKGVFDAAICLGNSLSLVEPEGVFNRAFEGLSRLLKPGGLLLAHTINYPMLAKRSSEPWGPVRTLEDGSLLLKGFIPHGENPWDVILIHLTPKAGGLWDQRTVRFRVNPHDAGTVESTAAKVKLRLRTISGGFAGECPDDPRSADLLYEFVKTSAG